MTSHRGAHPEDENQFSPSQLPTLRAAVHDLAWLRTRGYGDSSSTKIVGDRYRLRRRQRDAVARSACSDAERAHRLVRRLGPTALEGRRVDIDGFNVLISVEGLLGGAFLFVGRDGAYRDVDPVQGTYRVVAETAPAIRAIRSTVTELRIPGVTWWLDAQVSNVGRLKTQLLNLSPTALDWEVRIHETVDDVLVDRNHVVATSDSAVLDRVGAWCALEQEVISHMNTEPNVRDLRPTSDRDFLTPGA